MYRDPLVYGSDLDALLAISGAAHPHHHGHHGHHPHHPHHAGGLEMYGNDPYGAMAYGAGLEMYGAAPARASYPPWMQQRAVASMYPYGAMAYGQMLPFDQLNPSYGYGSPYAYGADAPMAHPRQPAAAARGVQVEQRLGQHVRRFPLGFTSVTAVNAGAAASVQAQPQVPFRPEKFVVPSDIAGSFDITNILVGKDSQFVVPNPIPARAFSETAVDNLLSFHGVAISQIITVQVSNTGGANLIFKAYMTGTAVE